jgi:hypothetical protein
LIVRITDRHVLVQSFRSVSRRTWPVRNDEPQVGKRVVDLVREFRCDIQTRVEKHFERWSLDGLRRSNDVGWKRQRMSPLPEIDQRRRSSKPEFPNRVFRVERKRVDTIG